jgi:hypothetical protein
LNSTHLRHLDVGDDNIKVLCFVDERQGLLARTGEQHCVAAPPYQFGAHLRHGVVVLHD